jgi:glyoxylase-like metal-dependent hydrolase (beta-lactamase superfamily II)
MNSEIFHFKVGSFACAIVNDGSYVYHDPGITLFENAPREELAATLKEMGIDLDSWHTYVSPYPSLVVNTGQHLVLVDTGMGPRVPTTGRLHANLRLAGYDPGDFDVVVLTHVHPDHVGGVVDSSGKVAFPNARFLLWRREWEFWTENPDLSKLRDTRFSPVILETAQRFLPLIKEQVDLIEPSMEIAPGITAIAAPGHTPGQLALVVTSMGEQLLAVADALLHPVHIERPAWVASIDLLVGETVVTRQRLCVRAAAEDMLVFAPHFDFPSLGRVRSRKGNWYWTPHEQEAAVGASHHAP